MTPSEMRLKFNGNQLEVGIDYPLGTRIVFQGEGEIVNENRKSIGNDEEYLSIKTIEPMILEVKDTVGTYPKQNGVMVGKTKSKQLYDVLYIYWKQQLTNKYPDYEKFYDASIDKIISDVQEKII